MSLDPGRYWPAEHQSTPKPQSTRSTSTCKRRDGVSCRLGMPCPALHPSRYTVHVMSWQSCTWCQSVGDSGRSEGVDIRHTAMTGRQWGYAVVSVWSQQLRCNSTLPIGSCWSGGGVRGLDLLQPERQEVVFQIIFGFGLSSLASCARLLLQAQPPAAAVAAAQVPTRHFSL